MVIYLGPYTGGFWKAQNGIILKREKNTVKRHTKVSYGVVEWKEITQDPSTFNSIICTPAHVYRNSSDRSWTSVAGVKIILLVAYIIEEPRSLPTNQSHDLKIILKEGTSPINARPYRYPSLQKDVMEKILQEMLEAGVVRPSQSPYSSPIVLAKKRDDTWRLCVDYKQLNKCAVLNKFPILVI